MVIGISAGLLALLNGYAVLLILARARLFHVPVYRPMLLNVGLSILPVVVAAAIPLVVVLLAGVVLDAGGDPGIVRVALLVSVLVAVVVWLLLFPNSMYLITELNFSHRRESDPVPLWFDIIGTLTLTMSGMLNGIASLAVIQLLVEFVIDPNRTDQTAAPGSWGVMAAAIVLGSFGVYLGRYIRVNSWDVKHPVGLASKIVRHFRTLANLTTGTLFVLTYSVFFGLLYALIVIPLRAAAV